MKTLNYFNLQPWSLSFALFLSFFLLCSCEKSDPVEPYNLRDVLSGSYWKEDLRLVYPYEGKDVTSENILLKDAEGAGGETLWGVVSLEEFYVEPASPIIRRYYTNGNYLNVEPPYVYTTHQYTIGFNNAGNIFRIESDDWCVMEVNAVAGYDITPLSVTPDQIVFDVPIKPFVYKAWGYKRDNFLVDKPIYDSHSIRVTWTRIDEPEYLQEAPIIDIGPFYGFIEEYLDDFLDEYFRPRILMVN